MRGAGHTARLCLLLPPPLESSQHEGLADLRDVWTWKAMTNSPGDQYIFNTRNLKQTSCLLNYCLAFTYFLIWPSLLAAVLTDFHFFCCPVGLARGEITVAVGVVRGNTITAVLLVVAVLWLRTSFTAPLLQVFLHTFRGLKAQANT